MNSLLNIEFWRSLPIIIQFLIELKKLWDEGIEESERREKLKRFKDALERSRLNRDLTQLDNFIGNNDNGTKLHSGQ